MCKSKPCSGKCQQLQRADPWGPAREGREYSIGNQKPRPRPGSHTERPGDLEWGGYFPLGSGDGPAHSKALSGPNTPGGRLCDRLQASTLMPLDSPTPFPQQGAPRTHGPSTFDLQMKFVCGQCWRNGQVVEPDKDLKYCSAKARHW